MKPPATTVRWHAVANDIIGGWAVATVDLPVSQVDHRHHTVVADMVTSETLARHIADLHNTALESR